ncbi:hypothetical protein AMATHDRAFT_47067 [Amanita thiersii Skay4041]|uniref:SEC7 domain-containing protein n=1 Tax=Amanita thiersii Skay4041 TaxID=703135 RepID=A0A2A9NQF9_9AGAR|nr:hypothetical protein AMATHDRAFT_47067 [Amanita thiersii Skay4041]
MDPSHHPSPSEQRMLAVARLKRAASLPRMKDGRRPPMHPEAMSEGEKAPTDEEKNNDTETPPPPQDQDNIEVVAETNIEVEAGVEERAEPEECVQEESVQAEQRPASPAAQTRAKRRSRSRSRSRGSKDFKGRARATQSPTPVSMMTGDSSQDDSPVPPPAIPLPFVISPMPHLAALQHSHLLRSPTPTIPEPYIFYPATASPTPMLPSLEAIQRGLFRSNSANGTAASRRRAFQKLIGADVEQSPPFTPPPPGVLGRNNTVSGGERSAARQLMLSRLNGRIAEAEANGVDDVRPSTPKRRRRRSRRGSTSATATTAITESDYQSTAPNTPLPPPTPSLPMTNNMVDIRSLSTTPNFIISASYPDEPQVESELLEDEDADADADIDPDQVQADMHGLARRRSLVIEEEDEDEVRRYPDIPSTPHRNSESPSRIPHSSDAPSITSVESEVPVFLSRRTPSRNEPFPSSPFTTPLKEKSGGDEDEVVLHADTHRAWTPFQDIQPEREMSWIPEAEYRIPVHDEEDEYQDDDPDQEDANDVPDEDADPVSARSSNHFSPQETYGTSSPRDSAASNHVVIESENFSDAPNSQVPPSPTSSAPPSQPSAPPLHDETMLPELYIPRLSDITRSPAERSPLERESTDLDTPNGDLSKRNGEASSPSTWEKMKTTLMRTASSSGRRSRSNSILNRDRRDQVDTSLNRESGNSLTLTKHDKGDSTSQGQQSLMQSPSASASILSLTPYTPTRGAPSPIPPATPADIQKYQDAKLFPFPGMYKLEVQRRAKGLPTASSSVPDVPNTYYSSNEDGQTQSFATSPTRTPELTRERKLSHQASDTRLVEQANLSKTSSSTSGSKLPMNLPAVRQWLTKRNGKKNPSGITVNPEPKNSPNKKPLLADILKRKESELGTDWEDISTPSTTSGDTLLVRRMSKSTSKESDRGQNSVNGSGRTEHTDTERTPKAKKVMPPMDFGSETEPFSSFRATTSLSTVDPQLSATPDPLSSVSDYAPPTPESSSRTSSRYSDRGSQGAQLLQRLEDYMARSSRASLLSCMDDPPRKLILSSPVLQVVNPNTVKDRLLFLFNDILVVAKPISQDQNPLNGSDKRCIVKSVVMLRDLRLGLDRGEFQTKAPSNTLMSRSSLVRVFVHQFSKDPDQAIATIFAKSQIREDHTLLGQLLFRTIELDRTKLGEYLSRRTCRSTLKAYLDSFGFVGLRVDQALRTFLLSVHIPSKTSTVSSSPLDYLLDQFSSRWYEANAKFVAYDKDLACRLVRALVQLNELLHGGVAQEQGSSVPLKQDIPSQIFVDAFRKADPRYLVSDEFLEDLYHSIRLERLSQARCSSTISSADQIITIKRSLPTRLTYKVQSDPIILRIPQADPQLTIQLYGQDLVFDPPVLTFAKSPEASFRVMGSSLGMKRMIMCRSGPNALKYSGLPQSSSLVVERAFMRNTFQVAFLNHLGVKRRYMFSVDDPIVRHQWTVSLKMQLDNTMSGTPTLPVSLPGNAWEFFRASQRISFRVLQETLTGVSTTPTHKYKDKINSLPYSTLMNGRHVHPNVCNETSSSTQLSISHTRSKSRSKVYHKHGAGRNELDLLSDRYNSQAHQSGDDTDQQGSTDQECQDESVGPTWSARELELYCQQNSILAMVSTSLLFSGQQEQQQAS